ncbi:MAG TPA: AAA family ATPase [Kofleriaceae bacterium]|nr:AAA family ATPase [Kofleriaceae bacterium]
MGGPIVGRRAELHVLETALADARLGRGGIVLLVGEPGIGKSRLVEEVARMAEGADVVWGRAWEAGGAPAYWPWTQVLRAVGGASTSPHVARVRGDSSEAAASSAGDRFFLFDAVARHLIAAATRPLVILFEDLHAADEPSLHLLAFLAAQLRAAAILVVGTYRDVEARLTQGAGAVLDRIAREARVVRPARLGVDEVRELARNLGVIDSDALVTVYRRSEGNPLFVVELLRVVQGRGVIGVPASVRTAIREHLAGLSGALRSVLEAVAVIGREVQPVIVADICKRPLAEVQDELARGVEVGVLVERGGGRIAFAHGLIAETLHDDIPAARRHELHLAVANWLDRDPSPISSEIAHHLLEAGSDHADRAADAVRKAAERARRELAFEPAAQLIERCLGTAPTTNKLTRFELVRLLAEVRILGGDEAKGKESAREAAELARGLDSAELIARAALTHGLAYSFGVTDQVLVSLLEEALGALPPGDHPLRARMLARLGAAMTPAPVAAIPMQIARDAIAMARRLGDERTRLEVIYAALSALLPFAPPAERKPLSLEVLELAKRFDDPLVELRSLMRLTFDHFELADLVGVDCYIRAYDECLTRIRWSKAKWHVWMFRAMLAMLHGRFEEQANAFNEAKRLAEEHGDGLWTLATRVGHELLTAWCRGDVETIERERLAFSAFASIPNQTHYPEIGAAVHLWLGEHDAARSVMASHPVGRMVRDHHLPGAFTYTADLAWRLGDRELAADLYPLLRDEEPPLPALHVHGFAFGRPMAHCAMILAATLGDLEASRRHFASCLSLVTRIGARAFEAHACHAFSKITPDAAEAHDLAARARVIADEIGIRLDMREPTPPRVTATTSPGIATSTAAATLRCEGEYWVVEWAAALCRVKATRGVEMLAKLVGEPGREFHALDLAGAEVVDAGDSGEVLDAEAKRAYRARMLELREELDEAEQWNNAARAERARDEIEALESELSRAAGLGGRDRRVGKAAERARVNVQRRLTDALKRISEINADLGKHFATTVRTGTYCSYSPERATRPR